MLCCQGRALLPLHQTDPGSHAQGKHLRRPFGSGLSKESLKTFSEDAEYVPLQRLNFSTGDYWLLWKSFALTAFIQLFFLKGSDLMLWHCLYITCRALALLETPVMSEHGTWRLPRSWGFGGASCRAETGLGPGTAS